MTAPSLSRRSLAIPPSPIRRLFNMAISLERSGEKVFRLDIGDPQLQMPARISEGIRTAIEAGHTHYSPMNGIPELREAIAGHMSRRLGSPVNAKRVVVSQGASQGLNAALQLTCDVGDTLLLPEVHWPNYLQQAVLAGVNTRFYDLNDRFQPRLEHLAQQIDGSVKAILVNSPSNPTGAVFPRSVVEALDNLAQRFDLWLLSDDAYTDYSFDQPCFSALELDCLRPRPERRVLGIYSFSKSYACTGMRMGWTVTPTVEVADQLALLNEPLTGSVTTPIQWGMVRALEEDDTADRREVLNRRRLLAGGLLAGAGQPVELPAGGLFYFLDIGSTGLDSEQFAQQLLEEERVAVVPGTGFSLRSRREADGRIITEASPRARTHIRLCFAVGEAELQEGIARLAAFVARN